MLRKIVIAAEMANIPIKQGKIQRKHLQALADSLDKLSPDLEKKMDKVPNNTTFEGAKSFNLSRPEIGFFLTKKGQLLFKVPLKLKAEFKAAWGGQESCTVEYQGKDYKVTIVPSMDGYEILASP